MVTVEKLTFMTVTVLTLDSTFLWVVVLNWYNTIVRIEDPDPYPLTNGGQT